MAGKNTAVFGIFPTHSEVELAVDELRRSGFRNVDISVLLPQNVGSKDLAHQKATKAPEGVTAGATTGAVLGGALGWLAGIGALAIPLWATWPSLAIRTLEIPPFESLASLNCDSPHAVIEGGAFIGSV